MTRLLIITVFSLSLAACTKSKAPGTNPTDMTAAEHREACLKHKRKAAAYDQRAKDLDGGKGTYTAEYTADEHEDVAKQHGDAGKDVATIVAKERGEPASESNPTADDCK